MLSALRTALFASLADEPPPWLLAFSAGLDSTVLLHAVRRTFPSHALHVLHVHHGLQEGANAWAQAACREASALGLQVTVERLQPPARFPQGSEAWARDERQRALERYAKEHSIRSVLLAHHQQDQAETLLINLIRGTGVDGLSAMPRLLQRSGLRWLRPLLGIPRSSLIEQAQHWKLAWVDDPSNTDPSLLRNRIRLEVLPLLEAIRPGTVARIAAVAEDLGRLRMRDVLMHPNHSAPEDATAAQRDPADVHLDLETLHNQHSAVQRLALHDWVKRVTGRGPSRARLNVLYELCFVSRSAQGYLRHGPFVLRRRGSHLHCEAGQLP